MNVSGWMVSGTGQAVASWLANVLALVALAAALMVALYEQRRANKDKLREQVREREAIEKAERLEREKRERLYAVVNSLIEQACTIMTSDLPDVGGMYMRWLTDSGKPLELRSIKLALESVRSSAHGEVDLLIDIAKASTILDAAISPQGFDGSPLIHSVLMVLREQSAALSEVRRNVLLRA